MSPKPNVFMRFKVLYKFMDFNCFEVKWAFTTSILLEVFFIIISLYSNFSIFQILLNSLLECIIAGLISLLGMAIAGVAIVIALFTTEQINVINTLQEGAFEALLEDFKWFALISVIEIALFIALIFIIELPYILPHFLLFYLLIFLLVYSVFYLLFYGVALINNCIKLSNLRCSIDNILSETKSISEQANEIALNYLISKITSKDKYSAKDFYIELVSTIRKSKLKNKEELIQYFNDRYINRH